MIVALLLLSLWANAGAASPCRESLRNLVKEEGLLQEVTFTMPRGSLSEAELQSLKGLFRSVNRKLPAGVALPPRLEVEVLPVSSRMRANPFNAEISKLEIGYRLGGKSGPLSFSQSAPLIVHEYSHLLFARTMSLRPGTPWQRINKLWQYENSLKSRLLQLDKDLAKAHGARKAEIESRIEELEDHYEHVTETARYLTRDAEAYDELFADVIAVIEAGDGQAIAKGHAQAGDPAEALLRDFTIPQFADHGKDDPHLALNVVRSHLWKKYLSKPEVRQQPGPLITALIDAIAVESDAGRKILGRWNIPPGSNAARSQRLIQRIDAAMAPKALPAK